jgi:hypothetical protein
MLRFVVLVRTDVSEERIASIIRVNGIGELGTTLAVTGNRSRLRRLCMALRPTRKAAGSTPCLSVTYSSILHPGLEDFPRTFGQNRGALGDLEECCILRYDDTVRFS